MLQLCLDCADEKDMGTGVYAFRMLVCQFRRELAFDDIFAFWERLWAAEQLAGTQLKVALQSCVHDCTCAWICIIGFILA